MYTKAVDDCVIIDRFLYTSHHRTHNTIFLLCNVSYAKSAMMEPGH